MTPLTWTEINGVLRAERDGAMYRVRYSSLRKAWESRIIFGGANSISRWYKEEYAKEVCQSHANAITKAGEEKSAALERTEEAWKKAEARLMELGDYYTALDEPQTVLEIRISTLEAQLKVARDACRHALAALKTVELVERKGCPPWRTWDSVKVGHSIGELTHTLTALDQPDTTKEKS